MTTSTRRTAYRACNLCEAICGLEIELERNANGLERVVAIRGDEHDPLSRGHICPKAVALQDMYTDPNRLRLPVKRTAQGWQTITWDEAFDLVVSNLKRLQEKHGPDAVGVYQGNPSVHNSGTLLTAPGFFKTLGTRNRFSATSVDQLPHHLAALTMFGHGLLMPIPDVDRTDFMLIFGANPLTSNGSLMTAPGMRERLRAIQARGGRVIVIDPRRTETAQTANEHHFVQPGTDVFVLLGMLHTVFTENLVRLGHLETVTDDLEVLRQAMQPFRPERVAARTRLEAATIKRLARDLANTPRAVVYGRMGISTQVFGGLCHWLVNALNAVTGHLDTPGGMMFPQPAIAMVRDKNVESVFDRYRSRVRNLPEFDGEFPVAALAEEITTPGDGQVRALVTSCGNPVLSTPNGKRLARALETLDFMVAIDVAVNETTRHAHVILPPATGLETAHYDLVFHAFAVRNTARYSLPTLPKVEGAKFDWEIFEELRNRFLGQPKPPRDPREKLELGLKAGPYQLSLVELEANPHGVDLGPLQPNLPERLLTPNQHVQLAPALYLPDLERAENDLGNSVPDGDFVLIGRRELRSNNSWMHHVARLTRGHARCTVMMHPNDAARLGITDGQAVQLRSRVGRITLPAQLTDTIMPGVISIPHGYGHAHNPEVQPEHAGVSINDLTDELALDPLTGNAVLNGVRVQLEAANA
jgi:anaerobic selenocysteine-containing dehydrogenase